MGILPETSRARARRSSPERRSFGGPVPSEVTLPTQIAHILQRLCRHHALITVSLPDCEDSFSSTILKLERDAGILSIDELNPEEGHRLLLARKRLRISARLKGVAVDFETSLRGVSQKDGIAIYSVSIPSTLH